MRDDFFNEIDGETNNEKQGYFLEALANCKMNDLKIRAKSLGLKKYFSLERKYC